MCQQSLLIQRLNIAEIVQVIYGQILRARSIQITRKLFEHPLWVQEPIQSEIRLANQDAAVAEIFKREELNYIYLTKL